MPRLPVPAPFRIRGFRFQWPADLLTSWAFEMETLILGWYVLVETGSVLMLTVLGSVLYVGTLIAPMMGVASDRIGHRNLLAIMRTIYAAIAAILTGLAFAGLLTPVVVCFLAALTGIVRPSDMGLRSALTAAIMPANQLMGALGIGRTTSDTARIAGALAGTGLAAAFGIGPAYVAITAFYALGALLTLGAVRERTDGAPAAPSAEVTALPSAWRDLREGIGHVWEVPRLLALVWLAFLFNLTAFSVTNALLPYVARDIYHVDQTGLGTLVASLAFGALAGSLALARSDIGMPLSRLMIISAIVWYVLLMTFAHMESLRSGAITLLLAGVAQSFTMVCHTVLLLRAAGQRFHGRVVGVRMLAIYSLPLGALAAGFLIERIGFTPTISLYAAVGLIFSILIAVRWRAALWSPQAA
jgi:MFS family permease